MTMFERMEALAKRVAALEDRLTEDHRPDVHEQLVQMSEALNQRDAANARAEEAEHALAGWRVREAARECDLAKANARVAELEREALGPNVEALEYRKERDAANARVAELEAQHDADSDRLAESVRHQDKAIARAESAESENGKYATAHALLRDELDAAKRKRQRAESEAAAWKAECEAAERDKLSAEAQANDWKRSMLRAESEAAALRAELDSARAKHAQLLHDSTPGALSVEVERLLSQVERVLTQSEEHKSRLAAATELLGRCLTADNTPKYILPGVLVGDIQRFLANAPAAPTSTEDCSQCNYGVCSAHPAEPTRTDHERAVLEACRNAVIVPRLRGTICHVLSDGSSELVARAVLAWREAVK